MTVINTSRPPALSELRFLYQPVLPLSGGGAWAEALVRWYLPDGTVRGPLDILPYWLAPPNVVSFTRFTLEQAAHALALAPQAGVSVNLSPRQALLPETYTVLDGIIPAVRARLRLEITEQHGLDQGALAPALATLRPRCGGILLDDRTPDDDHLAPAVGAEVAGVKIDRSVVWHLVGGNGSAMAQRFVRRMAERFEIVVAEGIEDPAMCGGLSELGVTHVQGFGVGRPRRELDGASLERRVGFRRPAPAPAPAPLDAPTPPPWPRRALDEPS